MGNGGASRLSVYFIARTRFPGRGGLSTLSTCRNVARSRIIAGVQSRKRRSGERCFWEAGRGIFFPGFPRLSLHHRCIIDRWVDIRRKRRMATVAEQEIYRSFATEAINLILNRRWEEGERRRREGSALQLGVFLARDLAKIPPRLGRPCRPTRSSRWMTTSRLTTPIKFQAVLFLLVNLVVNLDEEKRVRDG